MGTRDSRGRFIKGSGGKVTVRDNGADALLRRMRQARGPKAVTVGVHAEEGAAPHGDATVMDVAMFQEFGTANQEPQPFLTSWADSTEAAHVKQLTVMGDAFMAGKLPSLDTGLDGFGLRAVVDLRRHMAGMPGVEEGDPTPLNDTGKLIGSVSHRVES